jgi:transposase
MNDSADKGEGKAARVKQVNRQQLLLRPVDVEKLIEEDHPARAIWALVGQLNLERYYKTIQAVVGEAGRSSTDPRLLISLWLYAYSRGVSSAREIERQCQHEVGFQWLTGLEVINHHTLSDFRVEHQEALDDLLAQVLGVLSAEGLVTLEQVMHDGTKVRANAGTDTFRREDRLRSHLEAARQQVEAMGDPRSEDVSKRVAAARKRAVRARELRLEQALKELEDIRAAKSKQDAAAKEQTRASMSDPQARVMKQPDGGYAPSYNVQVSTDSAAGVIVGVGVTQASSDAHELEPAIARIEEHVGNKPKQMVVDGGFVNREAIQAAAQKEVELIGPRLETHSSAATQMQRRGISEQFLPEAFIYEAVTDTYQCPAGRRLHYSGHERRPGRTVYQYRAAKSDCDGCLFKLRCCPQSVVTGRTINRRVEDATIQAFQDRMETEEAKAIYRRRGAVAEFSNLWMKCKLGLTQFRSRGLAKVGMEARWVCLTHNVQVWLRRCWRPQWAT